MSSPIQTHLTQLQHWFLRPDTAAVAFSQESLTSLQALQQKVSTWLAFLGTRPGQRWAVYHNNADDFLAILLALWQLRRTACIPADNQPGTLNILTDSVTGFLGQCRHPHNQSEPERSAQIADFTTLDTQYPALELYTSGSTGAPQAIKRTLAQLNTEVAMLENLWPSTANSQVLTTVTHQHAYGMMFRLLWPFCSARPFARQLCEYNEDVLQQAISRQSFSLISSPAHLARLNPAQDWHQLHGHCSHIISAAAPLTRQQSLTASRLFGAPVREIYGSSETGAIAWRCQQDTEVDALWQPIPGVKLNADTQDALVVKTPTQDDQACLCLPDRVEFTATGQFRLLGRADRIAKVEGKRVSLTAIEQQLQQHDWIEDCKALVISRKREETAVVVELNTAGAKALAQQGRRNLSQEFRAILAPNFETVVLPRRWRFVDAMPYNPQGKLPLATLKAMFEDTEHKWPLILDQRIDGSQAELQCQIPSGLIYFDGHFDGAPILPGVTQVHWAEAYGRKLLGIQGRFERLEAVKFQHVISPNSQVTIKLSYDTAKHKLSFNYSSAQGVHASGRICYR